MAIYKGAAYARVTTGTGNRYFSVRLGSHDPGPNTPADGPVWDLVASADPVTLYYNQSSDGLTPPGVPNNLWIYLWHADTNTIWRSFYRASPATSATGTIYLTHDGTATGIPMIGDYRFYIRASRTDLTTYDVNSDVQATSGIVRISPSTMNVQMWHSGPSNPASYDDNIEVNIDLSHGYALDMSHRHFDVKAVNADTEVLYATQRTEGTDPQNALLKVDNRFPSEQVNVAIDVEVVAVPSAIAPDSEPTATWITIPVSTADRVDGKRVRKGPIPVDATIWMDQHMQINNNVYDPLLDQDSRLTSDLGFVTTRALNARSEPVPGITYRGVLRDVGDLLPAAVDRTETTGANGLPPTMAAWASQLPGGQWTHEATITAPADAVGLEFSAGEGYLLLAANPAFSMICGAGPSDNTADSRHLEPGMEVLIGLAIANVFTGQIVALDPGTAKAAVARFNLTFGRAEFLDQDGVWKSMSGATAYYWPLTPSPGDPNTHITVFPPALTAGWNVADLFIIGMAEVGGVPLTNFAKEPVVNGVNNHTSYKFDAPGFVGFPTR